MIAEYNGSNALLRRYAHGVGVDEPLAWYEGAGLGDRRTLFGDHQGSIIAAGAEAYAYSAYGEPKNDVWTGSRFRYTGQIALPEARLYHYKARVYDPKLGRFLQTDPIGYEDQWNLYAYVANDPVKPPIRQGSRRMLPFRGKSTVAGKRATPSTQQQWLTMPEWIPPGSRRRGNLGYTIPMEVKKCISCRTLRNLTRTKIFRWALMSA